MNDEKYVDQYVAAEFLHISPRRLLDMARRGEIPAHPLVCGKRKTWRFLLSELDRWMRGHAPNANGPISEPGKTIIGSTPTARNSTENNRSTSVPRRSSTSRRQRL